MHDIYYRINPDVPISLEEELEYDWIDYEHDFMDFTLLPNQKTRYEEIRKLL